MQVAYVGVKVKHIYNTQWLADNDMLYVAYTCSRICTLSIREQKLAWSARTADAF
jgi:hypothetical protein